jgi:DNA-binding XRE family transcriptional regulator
MKHKQSPLRAARIAARLKQIELAELADIATGTLNRLERYPGFRPSLNTAEKLARALGCKASDLFPKPKP